MRPSRKLSIVWATFALVVGIATRSDAGVLIDYESTPDGALAS